MDWTQGPLLSLCNLFPQVDDHIIKATALEHGDDTEAAVDFIRHEFLKSDMEVNIVHGFVSNSFPVVSTVLVSDTANKPKTVTDHPRSSERDITEADCNESEEAIVWLSDITCEPTIPINCHSTMIKSDATESKGNKSFNTGSHGNDKSLCCTSDEIDLERHHFQPVTGVVNNQEIVVLSAKSSVGFSSSLSDVFRSSETKTEDVLSNLSSMEHSFDSTLETFVPEVLTGLHTEEFSSPYPSPCYGSKYSLPHIVTDDNGFKHEGNLWGKQFSQNRDFVENISGVDDSWSASQLNSQLPTVHDDKVSWRRTSNISGCNIGIDLLDQDVIDAKRDKELLMKTIEDIQALWQRADDEEAAARKENADVAMAGKDTLKKVEELRKIAASLRVENEMRAGEIFGEKAVLAAEAWELQSRLVQLKAQKLKAAALLTDIQTSLQTRYEYAAKDRKNAEKEKYVMESSAEKILAIEESLLSKLVQESRDIDAEAEACTKLKEFLVKQGSIADSIQGEVAILIEDIEMLKKQIEEGVPSASSGIHSILRYSRVFEESSDSAYNEHGAASSQEFPRTNCAEGHSAVETGSCLMLSSGISMCRDSSVDSAMKSHLSTSFRCIENGAEHNIIDLMKPICNLDVDDQAASTSELTGSTLGTKYLSDDNDAEIRAQIPPQDSENLRNFKSININDAIIRSAYDDGSWHVLSVISKDGSTT